MYAHMHTCIRTYMYNNNDDNKIVIILMITIVIIIKRERENMRTELEFRNLMRPKWKRRHQVN